MSKKLEELLIKEKALEIVENELTPLLKDLIKDAPAHSKPHEQILEQAFRFHNLGQYQEALPLFIELAEDGSDIGAEYAAQYYFEGKGVEEDLPAAVKWYLKAAEQDKAEAQCMLGTCYSNGEGVTQDLSEAANWYLKAAEQGNAEALSYLTEDALDNGDIFQTDSLLDKGLVISPADMEKLSLDAKKGNPKAFYELGRLYDKTGNYYEARDCYIKALEGRYFPAAVPLKRLYLEKKVEYKRYEMSL